MAAARPAAVAPSVAKLLVEGAKEGRSGGAHEDSTILAARPTASGRPTTFIRRGYMYIHCLYKKYFLIRRYLYTSSSSGGIYINLFEILMFDFFVAEISMFDFFETSMFDFCFSKLRCTS